MKKSRKRQIDEKSEEVHESDTYCPSVQRALFKECKLEELLAESQLKRAGIQTAEALIQVLYEEIRSLKGHKQTLEMQISIMLRQSQEKEEHLKTQIVLLESHLKQVMQMRQSKAAQMRGINSGQSLSKCFLPSSSRKLSVPKSHKSIEKRNENKNSYNESPIRKMSLIQTVSKEYVENEFEIGARVCQQSVAALLSNDIERFVVNFEDIDNLLREEKDDLMQCLQKYQENSCMVEQLNKQLQSPFRESQLNMYQNTSLKIKYHSGSKQLSKKGSMRGKKLFCTQNSNDASPDRIKFLSSWEDRIKQQSKGDFSMKSVIKEYENIIQQYKQYSAYLRAYLCSCINFISKQTEEMTENNTLHCLDSERLKNSQYSECLSTDRSNNLVNFPSNRVFEVILREILTTVQDKVGMEHDIRKDLQEQNKQLRSILDQLVENLKHSGIKTHPKTYNYKQTYSINSQQKHRHSQQQYNNSPSQYNNSPSQYNNSPSQYNNFPSQYSQPMMSKQFEKKQKSPVGINKKDNAYHKVNKAPQLRRVTLTQYKRYNRQEE